MDSKKDETMVMLNSKRNGFLSVPTFPSPLTQARTVRLRPGDLVDDAGEATTTESSSSLPQPAGSVTALASSGAAPALAAAATTLVVDAAASATRLTVPATSWHIER